jgi:hypothetical protein
LKVLGDDTGALHVLELSSWKADIISKIVLNNPLPSVKVHPPLLSATFYSVIDVAGNITLISLLHILKIEGACLTSLP